MSDGDLHPASEATTVSPGRVGASFPIALGGQSLFNRPMAMHPSYLEQMIADAAAGRPIAAARTDRSSQQQAQASAPTGPYIGHILICTPLVHRKSPEEEGRVTAYSEVREAFETHVADPLCVGTFLEIDSGGGDVAGCFDLVDYVYSLRGIHPVRSLACDTAYSSANALHAAAEERYVTRTGGLGSIAVKATWRGQKKFDETIGLEFKTISSKRLKNTLDPHADLSPEGEAQLQAVVDMDDRIFVETQARNLGVDVSVIDALEGGCLYGAAAVPLLANAVATRDEVIAMFGPALMAAAQSLTPQPAAQAQASAAHGAQTMKTAKIAATVAALSGGDATVNPSAELPVAPAAVDSGDAAPLSNDPKPVDEPAKPALAMGARVRVSAPYVNPPIMGSVAMVPEKQAWVYGVKPDGAADGEPMHTYAEDELQPIPNEPAVDEMAAQAMSAMKVQLEQANAAKLRAEQDAQTQIKAAQDKAKADAEAAQVKADAIAAAARDEALTDALVMAGAVVSGSPVTDDAVMADPTALNAHKALIAVGAYKGTARQQVGALKAAHPGMFAQPVAEKPAETKPAVIPAMTQFGPATVPDPAPGIAANFTQPGSRSYGPVRRH